MAMNKEEIISLIKKSLPDASVTIEDLRGDGDHYSATVISKSFIGKSKIDSFLIISRET